MTEILTLFTSFGPAALLPLAMLVSGYMLLKYFDAQQQRTAVEHKEAIERLLESHEKTSARFVTAIDELSDEVRELGRNIFGPRD